MTNYSRAGAPFAARVVRVFDLDAPLVLLVGTSIRGTVRTADWIGLGFRRERSGLAMGDHRWRDPGWPTAGLPFTAGVNRSP